MAAEAVCVAATAVGLIGVLVAEWRDLRPLQWIMKPLASTGFVVLALVQGVTDTYGRAVLAALILSWLGDVLLIPKGARQAFLLGLVAFLLGHVGFAVAFLLRGSDGVVALGTALALAVPGTVVGRYFASRAPANLRAPVVAYIAVITVMVALAAGTSALRFDLRIALAAPLFYASDLFVARQRFLRPALHNRMVGLPLYYTAQVLFALSVAT